MKRTLTILICFVLVFCMIPMQVYAASLIVSPSTSTVAPGGTFTVTITGAGCAGRVNISASNGAISKDSTWVEDGSETITVTAGTSGTVTVTVIPEDMGDIITEEEFNPGAKSVSVAIVAPSQPSSTTKPSTTTKPSNNRGDFKPEEEGLPKVEEEPEEPVRPDQFEVTIGEKTYIIVEKLLKEDAPTGFKVGETTYDTWPVACYVNKDKSMILMLMQLKDSDEKAFFLYDEANQTFSSSIPVSVSDYLEKSDEYSELKQYKADTENAPNVLAIVLGVVLAVSLIFNGYFLYSIYKNKETVFKFLKK